jgi:hypothetical protein
MLFRPQTHLDFRILVFKDGGPGCRQRAKGATFFEATEGETARPMLDICWAPMLGALSVLFEEFPEGIASSQPSDMDIRTDPTPPPIGGTQRQF